MWRRLAWKAGQQIFKFASYPNTGNLLKIWPKFNETEREFLPVYSINRFSFKWTLGEFLFETKGAKLYKFLTFVRYWGLELQQRV